MRWLIRTIFCMLFLLNTPAFAKNDENTSIEIKRLGMGSAKVLAWSPNGTKLAVGGGLGVWLYDSLDAEPRLLATQGTVQDVSFADDGKLLVTLSYFCVGCSDDQKIYNAHVWDVETGQILNSWETLRNVAEFRFSSDGHYLAVSSYSGTVVVWNVLNGFIQATLIKDEDWVVPLYFSLSFSMDGSRIATGTGHGDAVGNTIKVWDTTSGHVIGSLSSAFESINHIVLSPDGRYLAANGSYNLANIYLEIWDVEQGNLIYQREVADSALIFTPNSTQLAFIDQMGEVRLYYLGTKTEASILTLPDRYALPAFMYILPDETLLMSMADNTIEPTNNLLIWNRLQGVQQTRINGTGIALKPDGTGLAYIDNNGAIGLVDTTNYQNINMFGSYNEQVVGLTYNAGGTLLAAQVSLPTYNRQLLRVWNVESGFERAAFQIGGKWYGHAPIFSPDGNVLAYVDLAGEAHLWDSVTGTDRFAITGYEGWVTSLAFTPDGRILLTGSEDGTVRLWDMTSGTNQAIWRLSSAVIGMIISPDGQTVAILTGGFIYGGGVFRLELWDMASGEQRQVLIESTNWIGMYFQFSPNSQQLFTIPGFQAFMQVWNVSNGAQTNFFANSPDRVRLSTIYDFALNPNESQIALFDQFGLITLLDMNTLDFVNSTQVGNWGTVNDLVYNVQGDFLATGGDTIRIWSVNNSSAGFEPVFSLPNPGDVWFESVTNLTYSPDGSQLAFGSEDGAVRILYVPDFMTVGG